MVKGTWILERCVSDRFPYRLQILRGDKLWLVLRTQDRWPAAVRHIFCLREDEPPSPDEELQELERVDIIAFLFISYIGIRAFFQPTLCPTSEETFTWRDKAASLSAVIAPLFLVLIVLGAIFAGVATPTEASAVGAFGSLVCLIAYGKFSWGVLREVFTKTIKISCMVIWLVIGASAFVSVYITVGATELVQEFLIGLEISSWFIVLIMLGVVFILGMFLEAIGIIMLFAPMFSSIASGLGIDHLLFAVLMIIALQVGYLTPPFGFSLFYMKAVSPPNISMADIYRSIVPFVGLMVLAVILIMIFPQIATWLPSVLVK